MTNIVKPAEAPKWMTNVIRQINNKFAAVTPTSGSTGVPLYKGTITFGDYVYNPSYVAGGVTVPPKLVGVNTYWTYSLPAASSYPNSIIALMLFIDPTLANPDPRFRTAFMLLYSDGDNWNVTSGGKIEQSQTNWETTQTLGGWDGFVMPA